MYQIQSVWGNTIDMPRMLKAVARALLFRGLALSDVRVCVPLRRFAQLDRVARAGGGFLRVEGQSVYTQYPLTRCGQDWRFAIFGASILRFYN